MHSCQQSNTSHPLSLSETSEASEMGHLGHNQEDVHHLSSHMGEREVGENRFNSIIPAKQICVLHCCVGHLGNINFKNNIK